MMTPPVSSGAPTSKPIRRQGTCFWRACTSTATKAPIERATFLSPRNCIHEQTGEVEAPGAWEGEKIERPRVDPHEIRAKGIKTGATAAQNPGSSDSGLEARSL